MEEPPYSDYSDNTTNIEEQDDARDAYLKFESMGYSDGMKDYPKP